MEHIVGKCCKDNVIMIQSWKFVTPDLSGLLTEFLQKQLCRAAAGAPTRLPPFGERTYLDLL